PDAFTEFTDRSGSIATAAEAADGGHARVIPAIHMPLVDQQLELALAGDRVVQVEPGKLVLARLGRYRQVVQEPLVQGPVILELQGTDRMGDALDGVGLAMGEVVAGIDAPLVTGLVMVGMADPVQDGVTQ